MTVLTADLADLTDDALAAAYAEASAADDDLGLAALLAEADRRDAAERAARDRRRAAAKYRQSPEVSEWYDAAYAQYLRAERQCRGRLLSAEGFAATGDEMTLWSGPEARARRLASEELNRFWDTYPRMTFTEYRRQARANRAAEREAYDDDQLAHNDAGSVRRESAAGTDRAVPGTGSDGDRRPDRPASRCGDGPVSGCRHPGRVTGLCSDCPRRGARAGESPAVAEVRRRAELRRAELAMPGVTSTAVAVRPSAAVATAQTQVNGAELLSYVAAYVSEFAHFPSPAAADAVALWAMHSHVRTQDGRLAWRATPRLLLVSAEPGSGKSRVLELLGRVCPNTFGLDTEPSVAGLAHTIGREHATVLIDEADVLFGRGARREGVRAVINSGYTADGTVLKMRGSKAERVPIFGPLALAGLDTIETATGSSLEALLSRCIRIRMNRAPGSVPELGVRADRGGQLLRAAMGSWAGACGPVLAAAEPEMPEGVHGRTAQIWAPLVAVAEQAGGDWPARARAALTELALRGGVSAARDADVMGDLAEMFG